MFQDFTAPSRPDQGPPRVADLRGAMARAGIDAFLVPRADAHQGEYVAPRDARLSWLTGFTGSAGMAVILHDRAAIFVDGRYTLQARDQVDDLFEIVEIPGTRAPDWLADILSAGATVGFDPWLHTRAEFDAMEKAFRGRDIALRDGHIRAADPVAEGARGLFGRHESLRVRLAARWFLDSKRERIGGRQR